MTVFMIPTLTLSMTLNISCVVPGHILTCPFTGVLHACVCVDGTIDSGSAPSLSLGWHQLRAASFLSQPHQAPEHMIQSQALGIRPSGACCWKNS